MKSNCAGRFASERPRRIALTGLLLWLGGAGCTEIIGVSDLPASTTGDGGSDGRSDGGSDGGDAKVADATRRDAADATDAADAARRLDGTHTDATDGGQADAMRAETGDGGKGDASQPPPPFEVSPTTLAFGDAGGKLGSIACGNASAPTRQLTLTNHTANELSWWTSLGAGAASPYKLSTSCTPTSTCSLGTGDAGTVQIAITGPLVPANAGMQSYNDTLTVFSTAAGEMSTNVALQASSYGAVLVLSQTDVNFGQQPENQPDGGYPQTLQLENNGNAPFAGTLTIEAPAGDAGPDAARDGSGTTEFALGQVADAASVGDATLITVAPASETPFVVSFDPAGRAMDAGGSLVVGPASATGLCAPLPSSVSLEGVGTTSPISVTSSLNFNQGPSGNNGMGVSCGLAGSAQNVTITNSSMSAATVKSLTLGLGAASFFGVPATTPAITIPAATATGPGSVTIAVTPTAIPKDAIPGTSFSDALTVVTSVAGDLSHTVSLQMTAAGVVLSLATSSIVVGTTKAPGTNQVDVFVTNTGNVNAPADQLTTTTTNSVFTWLPGDLNADQNELRPLQMRFQPTSAGTETYTGLATLQVSATTPICSPPNGAGPAFDGTLSATITGYAVSTQYDAINSTQSVMLNTECAALGSQGASRPLNYGLKNEADPKTVNWSASLTGPDAAYFTLSGSNGAIAPAMETNVTLTALGLSSTSALTESQVAFGLNAMLTFTFSGGSDTEVFPLPISEIAQGGYLAWSTPGELDVPKGAAAAFSLLNWSTLGVGVTITSGSPGFLLQRVGSTSSRLGRPLTGLVLDGSGMVDAMTTISAALSDPSTPMCAPVPAPLQVEIVSP